MNMQRQLNIQAAGWLLAIVILLGTSLTLLHRYQVIRHSAVLLRQADRALEQDQADRALRYFGLYLSYQPDDVDARARYGLTLEKYAQGQADHERALLSFDQVLRRDPERKDVRFRLIHCLINLQRIGEAMEQAQKLLPGWDKKGELEHILGWCCEAEKRYDQAEAWFRKAIARDPLRIDSYALLADILRQKSDVDAPAQTMAIMDVLVKENPDSYQAYLLRRRIRLLLNNEDKPAELDLAEKDLQWAMKLAPQEPEVVLAAAASAQQRGHIEDARAQLMRGIAAHPRQAALYKALAQLEILADRPIAAQTVLHQGVRKFPRRGSCS